MFGGTGGEPPVIRSVARAEKPHRIQYGLRDIPCLAFQRNRRNGEGTRADNQGHALTIEFDREVSLPVGLGYGAHFSLGLFTSDSWDS